MNYISKCFQSLQTFLIFNYLILTRDDTKAEHQIQALDIHFCC